MFESSYSATGFWDKLVLLPQKTGCTGIKTALTLFVILTECDTPVWVKTTIVAALGYFIFPFDLIPDFLPGGFIDDIAVMSGALAKLTTYVNAEVLERVNDYMSSKCL